MARLVYSTSASVLREIAALHKEAQLCRDTAASLSLHEERARMIQTAERHEARASALEADVQDEMLQTLDIEAVIVSW